jgi:Mg2+/Co2+ transporter CorC
MEEFIIIAVVLLVGIYAGWKAHEHFMVMVIKNNPEIMEEACRVARQEGSQEEITIETDDGNSITTKGVELAIEQVNGVMYAYSKATNQFIAQGETIEALLKSAHTRFPGKTFFGDLPE